MIQSLGTRSTTSPGADDLPVIGGLSRGVDQERRDREFIRLIRAGRVRPIGSWIWFLRNTGYDYEIHTDEAGFQTRRYVDKHGIAKPDNVGDTAYGGTILAIGPQCKHVRPEDIGGTIGTPDLHADQKRIQGEIWAVRESLLFDPEYGQACIIDGGRGDEV